ncbi:unnamed protein product [Thelazia callipaeda]|uniref:N-alpha-acetyltransferase 60 n=1 Tax=Thelazia callipaeda TaxID=103827 RepID=A0A0N5DBA4_THECL|nr:unnamed protein product [Thelazia callipaeda]
MKGLRETLDDSNTSKYISERFGTDGNDKCFIRLLDIQDMDSIKAICLESFPIQYPDSWFQEVLDGQLISFGIVCENVLAAILVAELKIVAECNTEDRDLLPGYCLPVVYILSVAVRPPYRRRGFASRLLNHLMITVVQQPPYPKAVYLHVLATNYGAISFYKKHGFYHHTTLLNYYCINGTFGDGLTFVLYVNGSTWSAYRFSSLFASVFCFPLRIFFKMKYILGF